MNFHEIWAALTAAEWRETITLTLFWIGYFAVHSLLASLGFKRRVAARWPAAMPYYRLGFNLIALLLLVPIVWLIVRTTSPVLWAWSGAAAWLANGIELAALLSLGAARHAYDTRAFIGLQQLATGRRAIDDGQRLRITAYHRHVRHPWYFVGLVLIWTRDMNAPMLVSALLLTAYLVVGSRFEENKLVHAYGDRYRRYMERVPGLLPWPGKSISAQEAAELENPSSASG